MTSMTTALALAPESERNIDSVIGRNVDYLIWNRRQTQRSVADELGMSPQSLSHKLRGRRPWTAAEILGAARWFRVPIDTLFRELPDLDSNQEPIGFKSKYVGLRGRRLPDQLAEHRRAKQDAHDAVEYRPAAG